MGMPRGTKPIQGHVYADSTTYSVQQEGPVMLCYGADNLVVAGWARQGTGNLRVKAYYRTFVSRRQGPGPWTAIGSARTPSAGSGGGEYADSQSLTSVGAGMMWIQGGVAAGLSAAGNGEAESAFQCFAESRAQVAASQTFSVQPDTNATKTAIIPFGSPVPALGLTGAMVAGEVVGVSGTIKLNFAYREFTSDLKLPGAWGSSLITEAALTADGDYNSGHMAITPTSGKAFVQLGVVLPANDARGNLDFALAWRY